MCLNYFKSPYEVLKPLQYHRLHYNILPRRHIYNFEYIQNYRGYKDTYIYNFPGWFKEFEIFSIQRQQIELKNKELR